MEIQEMSPFEAWRVGEGQKRLIKASGLLRLVATTKTEPTGILKGDLADLEGHARKYWGKNCRTQRTARLQPHCCVL
jgi:hypothetical protein